MHSGIPLQDEDRWPWLDMLADIVHQHIIRYKLVVHHVSRLSTSKSEISVQTLISDVSPAVAAFLAVLHCWPLVPSAIAAV